MRMRHSSLGPERRVLCQGRCRPGPTGNLNTQSLVGSVDEQRLT